jgi:hypothetical protein
MLLFLVRGIGIVFQEFSDPCLQWVGSTTASDGSIGTSFSATLPPPDRANASDPCASRVAAIGTTKGRYVAQMLIVSGGMLLGIVLGMVGVFRHKSRLTLAGGILTVLEGFLSFSLFPVVALTACGFLVVGSKQRSEGR